MKVSKNISRIITVLTGIVIFIVMVVFPLGYFFVSYQNMTGALEAEAEINARNITTMISANPEMWEFQQLRLQEYLSRRPIRGDAEIRRILNLSNKLVAENADILEPPIITRSENIHDSGVVAGRVEISRSMRPIIKQTGVAVLLMLPLGLGVFLIVWLLPIRTIYRTEKTLRESEERFRELSLEFQTVLDCIRDPLFQLNNELMILWANKGASAVLNKESPAVTGKYCYELWHGRSIPCEICPSTRSFEKGTAEGAQISTPDGRLFDERVFPVKDENGGVKSVVVLATDITEKTNLQAEMLRAGHLASLGELAAGIAHEINNPINGVINYAQLLADKMPAGTREEDMASRIIKEGSRVAEIVRSLLSFARAKKDEKIPVRIKDVLSESFTLTMAQIQKDNIHVTIDIPEHLPSVMANPQQLQQVFLNVLNNARYALNQKYPGAHEYKKIEIKVETVLSQDNKYVQVGLLDYGTGIPSGILNKVMNPFFTTKPSGSGTGLGLSISYGIIKDHSGSLRIESEQDKFTKVIITLPQAGIQTSNG
ncbi:MAG: PAS domain-containing protein [Nitrospirae bacterium]|nr:PAS domain-containing protein [Nitrospirota bacterium]